MAKRKSLAAQLFEAHQKKKAEQRREHIRQARADAAEAERLRKAAVKAEEARLRQIEQAERRQARQEEQEEKAAQREQQRVERERAAQAAQIERENRRRETQLQQSLKRREVAQQRERTRLAEEQRRAEAEQRTAAMERKLAEFNNVLATRTRELQMHAAAAEALFNKQGIAAFSQAVEKTLAASRYPDDLHVTCRVEYRPESRELRIDCELPRQDVIPTVAGYRHIKTDKQLRPEPRKTSEIQALYRGLIARVALRVVAEVVDVTPLTLVDSIAFNGYVSAKDKATGKPIRPCLLSLLATRELFDDLVLDEPALDPVLCLAHLNAIVSPHPYDLESVRPVVTFDLSSYRFVEEMDVVAGLDSRTDLLALTPNEFEHVVRRLFEAVGMKSMITQASRDGGVDAVATNEDPLLGGLCVIQAKRYKDVVGLESVHALAGVMDDKNASKGILVTTSWFGKASHDFAAKRPRIQLIDGRNLKSMLQEHLGLDVLIGLPKLPRGWQQHDIQ